MAGRSIESRENQRSRFDEAPAHPEGPIRRYSHKVKTPNGRKVIIIDVHNQIPENTPGLKRVNPEKAPREESGK